MVLPRGSITRTGRKSDLPKPSRGEIYFPAGPEVGEGPAPGPQALCRRFRSWVRERAGASGSAFSMCKAFSRADLQQLGYEALGGSCVPATWGAWRVRRPVHSCPALGLGLFLQATGACSFSAFLLLRMLRVSQFLLLLVHRSLLPCLICHWSHPVDSHQRFAFCLQQCLSDLA